MPIPKTTTRSATTVGTAASRTSSSGRAKYVTPDQKKALAQCDAVVKALRTAITAAAKKNPLLAGITAKGITVDTLGDFPFVAVKKNGQPLFDRQFEIDALRKLLPASLKRVPMGEISPY